MLTTEIIQWGYAYLSSHGYTLNSPLPETVQNTPWSYVARFVTSEGYIYLKHTPELLALEVPIIQAFREQFHASVPEVIAYQTELHCFLMKDAGKSLREILKKTFDTTLFCKAIDHFTALQLAVTDRIDVFIDLGAPDWRLDKLPDLYKSLISKKDLLLTDGLSDIEITALEALVPKVTYLCEKLSAYSIKPTFVQPDFNDNNTLISDVSQTITIIDLGEITISHPFFSLINCLQQIKKHQGLKEEDEAYLRIMDACLKNYLHLESKPHLLDAFLTARILFPIYRALSHYRLRLACDKTKFTSSFQWHGKPSIPLKEFMTASIPFTNEF